MEVGLFGSAVLWLLVTFPAYWLFQWTVEGEPFTLWQRRPRKMAAAIGEGVSQTIAEAGAQLSVAAAGSLTPGDPALDASITS